MHLFFDEVLTKEVFTHFRFGAPVFVSQPHFYLADPYYSSLVHGMRPDHEKHTTSLKIEPLSGVPVEVMAKFQLNILIDKVNLMNGEIYNYISYFRTNVSKFCS